MPVKKKSASKKIPKLIRGPKARTAKGFAENIKREKELGQTRKRAVGTAYGEAYYGIDDLERAARERKRKAAAKRAKAKSAPAKKAPAKKKAAAKKKEDKNWIQGAIKHPGALRKTLKVKEGEKIPVKKLKAATKSKNPTTRRRANLALTLRKLRK